MKKYYIAILTVLCIAIIGLSIINNTSFNKKYTKEGLNRITKRQFFVSEYFYIGFDLLLLQVKLLNDTKI